MDIFFEIIVLTMLLVGAVVIMAFSVNVIAKNTIGNYLFRVKIERVK